MVSSIVSMGTLAMMGIGAGVGYGLGGWLAERLDARRGGGVATNRDPLLQRQGGEVITVKNVVSLDVQDALGAWQTFLHAFQSNTGRPTEALSVQELDEAWRRFEEVEPVRADHVRPLLGKGQERNSQHTFPCAAAEESVPFPEQPQLLDEKTSKQPHPVCG